MKRRATAPRSWTSWTSSSTATCAGRLETIQLDMAAIRIGQRFDIFLGGLLGRRRNFPSRRLLEVLWRAYLRTGVPQFLQLVSTTLDNMLLGGLYDHVGGGFFRYTMDERWLVPHFEKMLYDNALLIDLMTQIWQFNRNELCRQRVSETIDWLLREMKLGDGFRLRPGRQHPKARKANIYLWSEAEIDAAPGRAPSRPASSRSMASRATAISTGKNILRRLGAGAPPSEADEALLTKQRGHAAGGARQARTRRCATTSCWPTGTAWRSAPWPSPARCSSAPTGSRPRPSAPSTYVVKAAGRWRRAVSLLGRTAGAARTGFADDYAQMARAALQLWEVTGEKRFLGRAKTWVRTLNSHFWDEARGGYYFTAHDADPLIVRTRMIFDQPTPSANGTMIAVLTRLALLTGDGDYGMPRPGDPRQAFAGEVNRTWISCGEYAQRL